VWVKLGDGFWTELTRENSSEENRLRIDRV
jgi:hypothetical protein